MRSHAGVLGQLHQGACRWACPGHRAAYSSRAALPAHARRHAAQLGSGEGATGCRRRGCSSTCSSATSLSRRIWRALSPLGGRQGHARPRTGRMRQPQQLPLSMASPWAAPCAASGKPVWAMPAVNSAPLQRTRAASRIAQGSCREHALGKVHQDARPRNRRVSGRPDAPASWHQPGCLSAP